MRRSLLGRNGCGWEDNIKMYLQKLGCEDNEWIYLAQGLDVVDAVMRIWFP
jgi:hypothetical protein